MIISQIDRGAVWNERQQIQFRVRINGLLNIGADGEATSLGTIAGDRQVSLPYSFNTQAIIGGGRYYLYDPTNGFRRVTDVDVGHPIDGVWVDGYYFFTDGEYLYHTELANESAIDPLKFATSEFSPDPTLGVGLTVDDKVIAFNRYTTEYFVNQANEDFAFTRLPGRNVTAGIVATHAKTKIDGIYYCMGGSKESDLTIYALGTGSIQDISTREVNKLLNSYAEHELEDVVMESRTVDNYPFLIVHLPDHVLMCNMKLLQAVGPDQAWSILQSASEQNTPIPYRAINGVLDPRRSQWVYGDKFNRDRAYLDSGVATHYGQIVPCSLNTPFIYLEIASIDELEINTIPGFTAEDDAEVFLSLTYDGVNYSQERLIQYGQPSEFTKRFIARRMGSIRNWFSARLRWNSRSRMAFGLAKLKFG